MQKYILFALIAMAIYSITPILYKKIPKTNAVSIIFLFSVAGLIFSGLLLFIPGNAQFNMKSAFYAILVGVLINVAFLAYITAVRSGPVGVSTIIRHLSVPVTFILAIIFLSEKVTMIKGVGAALGVIAVILLSL